MHTDTDDNGSNWMFSDYRHHKILFHIIFVVLVVIAYGIGK